MLAVTNGPAASSGALPQGKKQEGLFTSVSGVEMQLTTRPWSVAHQRFLGSRSKLSRAVVAMAATIVGVMRWIILLGATNVRTIRNLWSRRRKLVPLMQNLRHKPRLQPLPVPRCIGKLSAGTPSEKSWCL